MLNFVLGLAIALVPALLWDVLRPQHTGFFQQSIISYGGLNWAPLVMWPERVSTWLDLSRYVTGSSVLDACWLIGVPLLLVYGIVRRPVDRSRRFDWAITLFIGLYLLVHTILQVNLWDRYLLGIVPLGLLLLGRILVLPGDVLAHMWPNVRRGWTAYGLGIAILLAVTLFRPAQDAVNSRFPIGGAHGAYNGFEALVNYFRGHVAGGSVVYHRWLGWHYSFYLFDFPYLFQWYNSTAELVEDATSRPGVPRYIAFPSWQSATQARWELQEAGLHMHPIYEAYREDGSRSFTLYRIEEMASNDQPQ